MTHTCIIDFDPMKKLSWNFSVRSVVGFTIKALVVLLALVVILGFAEVNNAIHPPRIIPPGNTLRKYKVPYESINLYTEDGIRLSAWYTPPKNGVVILLAHGYGDNRPEWVYEMLAKKDYGVLAWDARAHGESDGTVSTIGYLEVLDVKAALDFALAQPGVQHVGAETGINLDAVSPLDDISKISPRPVYIVHSTADIVAPPDAGEKLFNAAHEPRFFWLEKNAPHLAIYLDNPRRYQRRLVGFFDEWLLGK